MKAGIEASFDVDFKTDYGTPLLAISVGQKNYEMCELFLKKGARPNATDVNRETALMWAAERNNLKICKLLVAHGASVRQTSRIGQTALIMAARTKNYELIKFLLSKGSNVNKQDEDGDSILHLVIPCSNQLVQLLIDHGADIDAVNNDDYTPLMNACRKSNLGNASTLAQAGAEFEVGSRSAWSYCNQQVTDHLERNGYSRPYWTY